MGTGKSTSAINYVNENTDKSFIIVLPTLAECERFKNSTRAQYIDPKNWETKYKSLLFLCSNGCNIVTTHALISKLDNDLLEILKSKEYILIIDECLDVLSPFKLSKNDTDDLFKNEYVYLDQEGYLRWNEEKESYKGRFDDIKRLCSFKSLMGYKRKDNETAKILMWNFPVAFFECFERTHIFTYLWEGSIQKAYFDLHQVKYDLYTLNDNMKIVPYDIEIELRRRSKLANLINIYDGKYNRIGDPIGKSNPLSKSWYSNKKKHNKEFMIEIKRAAENFFRTVSNTNSEYNMYTVFKPYRKTVSGKGYTKGFVPCNAKGTNDFKHKKSLAYLINFFVTPDIGKFIHYYNFNFNEELFSLSALLQWIWRSQIREGKPIDLYIPSQRMRNILIDWLNEGQSTLKKSA